MASAPYHERVYEAIKQAGALGAGLGLLVGIFTAASGGLALFGAGAVLHLLIATGIGAAIGGATGLAVGSIGSLSIFSRDASERQEQADRKALHDLVAQSRSYEHAQAPVVPIAGESPQRIARGHAEAERARRATVTADIVVR